MERHTWRAPGVEAPPPAASWSAANYQRIGLGRWAETFAAGEVIAGPVRRLPERERAVLHARGMLSFLAIPVYVQGAWWGFLGFGDCTREREWSRSEIDALRTAAGTLGAALHRSQIEEALRTSKERLDLALEGGDLGLWDWDIERDQVVFNERWARMLGYSLSAIEPNTRAWQNLIHPEDKPRLWRNVRAHLKGETDSFEMEIRMRNDAGAWRWILSKGKVVSRTPSGWALRASGTHLDITTRKETEEALRRSQELFRLMYEESPLGLSLCAMDGRFVQANRAFLNIVGYAEHEIQSLRCHDITPPRHAREEADRQQIMRETGRFGPEERFYIRKGGELVPVLINGCLIQGQDGDAYIWSIVENISARKAAEQALAEARAYEREIETRIEETLLRGRPPVHLDGVDIAAVALPNQHMDGDFAEFIPLGPQCFDVLVGDVMGKGIFAALVSAGAKSSFLRALASQLALAGGYPSPADLVGAVHRDITRQLMDLDCFLTLHYARFDLAGGSVSFVDCGHTKPIHYAAADHTCRLLEGDNVPIGFLEVEHYNERRAAFAPGDVFLFYSDGLTETRNAEGAMFGVERLIETVRLHASLEARALTRKVVEGVARFSGAVTPADDRTCVVVKILEPGASPENAPARLVIAAMPENLVAARTFVQDYLATRESLLGGGDDFNRIVLASVEALSNIIKHSFGGGATREIAIELRSSRNRLAVTITHGGTPFKPRSTPLPDPSQRRESGYGLYIMNRCFDDIAYETTSGGAQSITLLKHFTGELTVDS